MTSHDYAHVGAGRRATLPEAADENRIAVGADRPLSPQPFSRVPLRALSGASPSLWPGFPPAVSPLPPLSEPLHVNEAVEVGGSDTLSF
jgi:hypothetical protein